VYIHKPKTGGTFVTDALLRLYEGKWNLWKHAQLATTKKLIYENRFGKLILTANKHGGCSEIPGEYRREIILSTLRNPFDYYVSQYEFGWWKRKEWHKYYRRNVDSFNQRFASFPDLSFTEFMELMPVAFNPTMHGNFSDVKALGRYKIEFIESHFHKPDSIIPKINDEYIESRAYRRDMFPVTFIFTHKLNQQLYEFLLEQGYPPDSIEFILKKEKVLPQGKGRTKDQKWEKYYTPELKELVREKDWLLFKLFPEFDGHKY
ncbi:MAG: hypothetical protein H0X70_09955, partial [Segetibacter sp.]|nr:hypothetical protein [Segetibacter sp.]